MYEQKFQLKAWPFPAAPNGQQYVPNEACEQALLLCKNCVDRQSGPALILGAAGTGKTLILGLLNEYYAAQFQVVSVACSRTESRMDLMQNILFQLGQSFRDMTESEVRLELSDYLRPGLHCPNGILVLVDDANCLSATILDEFRLLSGIIRGGQVRCHLILAGSQRLEELLSESSLESLNQRVAARCYLTTLSQAETSEYVRAHLRKAGGGNREFFVEDALRKIHQLTGGVPRLVNQLCDHALIQCGKTGVSPITKNLVWSCWSELQRLPDPVEIGQGTDSRNIPLSNHSSVIEFGELDSLDDVELVHNELVHGIDCSGDLDEYCEGKVKNGGGTSAKATIAFSENLAATRLQQLEREQLELISTAEQHPISMPFSDLDPDKPFESKPASNDPARLPQTNSNPFDEEFESEEIVTDTFVQTAIGHNHAAATLTRYEIEHYGVDDLPTWATPKDLLSMFHGKYPSQPNSGTPQDSQPATMHELLDSNEIFEDGKCEAVAMKTVDDRDILIVSRTSTRTKQNERSADEERHHDDSNVSTGRAVRMDYKQLFQQLRGAGPDSSNSTPKNN